MRKDFCWGFLLGVMRKSRVETYDVELKSRILTTGFFRCPIRLLELCHWIRYTWLGLLGNPRRLIWRQISRSMYESTNYYYIALLRGSGGGDMLWVSYVFDRLYYWYDMWYGCYMSVLCYEICYEMRYIMRYVMRYIMRYGDMLWNTLWNTLWDMLWDVLWNTLWDTS